MLNKKHRATSSHIREALSKGLTRHSENFSVRIAPSKSTTKVAIVISKKVSTTAVGRNKLRRRIREALQVTKCPKGSLLVLYAKKGALSLSLQDIRKEVAGFLV